MLSRENAILVLSGADFRNDYVDFQVITESLAGMSCVRNANAQSRMKQQLEGRIKLADIGEGRMPYKWLPVVLAERCTGCGLCVDAWGPKSLVMAGGIAQLACPETCGGEEHCISACRDEAIQMPWLPSSGAGSVGKWGQCAIAVPCSPPWR